MRYLAALGVSAAIGASARMLETTKGGPVRLLLLLGWLVLYGVGEWAFEPIFSRETGERISTDSLSLRRIALALLLMLPPLVLLLVVSAAVSNRG